MSMLDYTYTVLGCGLLFTDVQSAVDNTDVFLLSMRNLHAELSPPSLSLQALKSHGQSH